MTKQEIIEQIKKGTPFDGLGDIHLVETRLEPVLTDLPERNIRPDVAIILDLAGISLTVYGEVKTQVSPKLISQIGTWLARAKALNSKGTYALVCPFISPQSQRFCQENKIDFIDLSGNVLLRIPGKVLIERLGRPNVYKEPQRFRNPFGGASSRVPRVLLEFPNRVWTVTDIEKELIQESERQNREGAFKLSISSISKTIQSLEEELLIRRERMQILVPDPHQLLLRWIEKYCERYKFARRSAWTSRNPFGFDIESSVKGLNSQFPNLDPIVTGTAAANLIAPFTNIDQIDIFVQSNQADPSLRNLNKEQGVGPDFLFIYPYDRGVAMYARKISGLPVASNIQTYLDCYARGGRDRKQADYLLANIIEKQWDKT